MSISKTDKNNEIPSTKINTEIYFFENIKINFNETNYLELIKLLHLYNIGVLNWAEFIDLVEPFFSDDSELYSTFKQILYLKITNRRNFVEINKLLTELDFSSTFSLNFK